MRFFLLLISSTGAPFLLPANDVVAHSVYLYRDMLMRVNECNGRPALLITSFFSWLFLLLLPGWSVIDASPTHCRRGPLCMSPIDSWEFDKRFTPRSVTKATTHTHTHSEQERPFFSSNGSNFYYSIFIENITIHVNLLRSEWIRLVLDNFFDAVQQILFDVARNRGCMKPNKTRINN